MKNRAIILLALAFVVTLCFAGCAKTETMTVTTDNSASPTSEATTPPDPSDVSEESPSTSTPAPTTQARYEIPEGHQFYGRFDASDDPWMDADGNIWLGDTQFTFNKDTVPAEPEEPVDPATLGGNKPNFHDSDMKAGEYPDMSNGWIKFGDFYDAVVAKNSNFTFQGTRESAVWTAFDMGGHGSLVWNNGAISVGVFVHVSPAELHGNNLDAVVIEAWYTYEETDERVTCWSTDDPFGSVDNNYGIWHSFAQKLWDTMAMADKATTIEEMRTISEKLGEGQ
ncbi:hypothetical protein FACS1894132_02360 [Clostridia bacterium]|nr:hypothetical protein FACS1894132_02360 [Clostridia bacterium]